MLTDEMIQALSAPYDRDKFPLYRAAYQIMTNTVCCDCNKPGCYIVAKKEMIKRGLNTNSK